MSTHYVAAMALRKNLLVNPDGKIPVLEHAFDANILKTLCGHIAQKLEILKHDWNPVSPHTCPRCLRRYKQSRIKK